MYINDTIFAQQKTYETHSEKPGFSHAADQLCNFRPIDSTIRLLPNSKISNLYPSSGNAQPTLGENSEDRFSQNEANEYLF